MVTDLVKVGLGEVYNTSSRVIPACKDFTRMNDIRLEAGGW